MLFFQRVNDVRRMFEKGGSKPLYPAKPDKPTVNRRPIPPRPQQKQFSNSNMNANFNSNNFGGDSEQGRYGKPVASNHRNSYQPRIEYLGNQGNQPPVTPPKPLQRPSQQHYPPERSNPSPPPPNNTRYDPYQERQADRRPNDQFDPLRSRPDNFSSGGRQYNDDENFPSESFPQPSE